MLVSDHVHIHNDFILATAEGSSYSRKWHNGNAIGNYHVFIYIFVVKESRESEKIIKKPQEIC